MERRLARRIATWIFLGVLVILLFSVYVALVYADRLPGDWIIIMDFGAWVATFAILLLLLLIALVVLLFMADHGEPEPGKADVQVVCAACQKSYVIEDTGQRPLYHVCPHCAHTNTLGGPDVAAAPITAPVEETQEQIIEREEGGVVRKFLVLRCGACQTQFETPYTAERPLVTSCGNCGRQGILRAPESVPVSGESVIEIEGIGAEYSKKLAAAGVKTIPELRAADATTLAAQTGLSENMVRDWQGMADLMQVQGIGPQYSELLVKSGVASVQDLSEADPDELLERIEKVSAGRSARIQGNVIGKKTVKNWIKAAKKAA